jgi:ferredoxin
VRIVVDRTLCQSMGNCEAVSPAYFQVDDDGSLALLREDVEAADVATVQHAVSRCPTGALSLTPP